MSRPSGPASSAPTLKDLRAARGKPVSPLRRFRVPLIAAGLLVALLLAGFFGAPPIIKAQAIKQLSDRLGRDVSIGELRLNPLVWSAVIEDFFLAEEDGQPGSFVEWRRLYVNVDSWSLLSGEIRFQDIELDGFLARARKTADGGMNFDDIVARLRAASETESGAAGEKTTRDSGGRQAVSVGRLAVNEARIEFSDDSMERPYATTLGPLTFSLTDFHTVGDPDAPYQFDAITAAGERLAWRGTLSVDPVKSQGELVLSNIDLARLSPYYHRLIEAELHSARLDVAGRYTLETQFGVPRVTWEDGSLVLRDVRLGSPGAATDALSVRRFEVRGVSADSAGLSAQVAAVAIEGVRVNATRDAAGLDLVRLLTPRAGSADTPSAADATRETFAPPHVTLAEFSLSDVKVELTDHTTPRRAVHRVEDVVLTLRELDSSALERLVPLALAVTLPQAGRIAVVGSASAAPLVAELDLTLEQVPLANASPYLEPLVNLRLTVGTLRGQGRATLREGVVTFAGEGGLAGFASVDGKLAEDLVNWTDIVVTGLRATSAPLAVHADLIRIVEPAARLRIETDGTLHIAQAPDTASAAGGGPATQTGTSPDGGKGTPQPLPLAVTVGRVELVDANFRYEDRSSRPPARGALTGFSGWVNDLSSDALGRADLDLRGKVDGVAPVAITGTLNPLGTPAFLDVRLDFKGIDLLPGAGPYIARFAGRDLARGNLSLVVDAKLKDRKVDLRNVVTLDQFNLGAPNNSPDGTNLPVNLALALLRDTNGQIVLDVPVQGSLDDPEFRIGRVVIRVLVNILTKAATSPFSLLGAAAGGLTGGDGASADAEADALGWQDFAPGAHTPDAIGIQKLTTLASALAKRPALGLDIAGSYDSAADEAALRRARFEAEVRARAWEASRRSDPSTPPPEGLEISPELRAEIVAQIYETEFPGGAGGGGGAGSLGEIAAARPAPVLPVSVQTTTTAPEAAEVPRRDFGRLPKYTARGGRSEGLASLPAADEAAEASVPLVAAVEPATAMAPVAAEAAGRSLPPLAEMERGLLARIAISDTDLPALASARAEAVRDWLSRNGGIAAERLTLVPGGAGRARVTLQVR